MINLNGIKSAIFKQGRPLGISIVGYVEILISLYYVGFGVYVAIGSPDPASASVIILMALVDIALSVVWLKGLKWAWYLKVILACLSVLVGLVKLDIVKIIVKTLIVVYCFRKIVRQYFRISQEKVETLYQNTDIPNAQ